MQHLNNCWMIGIFASVRTQNNDIQDEMFGFANGFPEWIVKLNDLFDCAMRLNPRI